ncbi:mitochondrial protein, partial [Scheffersomyces stipitis CBS 6054]
MLSLYFILGTAIAVYVAFLFLVNRIPHLRVKSLGWLSLKHVTLEVKSTNIYIRKVQLRFNFFGKRNKDSALKLFNIELVDVDVKSMKKEDETPRKSNPVPLPRKPLDLPSLLSCHIPKKVFDMVVNTRIINQFNIHIFRCSYHDEDIHERLSVFVDYLRLESRFDTDASAKFIVSSFNGYLNDADAKDENQVKLFRNFEFLIHCDTAAHCDLEDSSHVILDLSNLRVSLSIGRMSIPLDTLIHSMKERNEKSVEVNKSKGTKKIASLTSNLDLINQGLDFFSSLEVKLEEISVEYKKIKVNAANFVTTVTKELGEERIEKLLKLAIYLTSIKLFHKESKSMELPSGTLKVTSNPIDLIKVAESLVNNTYDETSFVNLDTSLMLTNPIFDIYHDQSEYFLGRAKTKKPVSPSSDVDNKKMLKLFRKLKEFSNRILIVDTVINLHLPNPSQGLSDIFNRKAKGNLVATFSLQTFYHKFYTKNFNTLLTNKSKSKRFSITLLFKVKNFQFLAADNSITWSKVNLLAVYNVLDNCMSLKLSSKNTRMKSVNEAVFHLVREFRNRRIIHYNMRYNDLARNCDGVVQIPQLEDDNTQKYIDLFEVVPDFISTIKVSLSNVQADVVCKDGLPSHIIYDESMREDIDLGEFKRGVSLKLTDLNFTYKKAKEDIDMSIKSFQMFTLSDHASEYIADFDEVTYQVNDSDLSDLSSLNTTSTSNEDTDEDDDYSRKIKKVLAIRDITLSNKGRDADTRDINRLHLHIPEVDGRIDMFFVWCSIYAKTLVKYFAPTVERNCTKDEMKRLGGSSKRLKLDITVDSTAIVTRLPTDVDIMFELDKLKLKDVLIDRSVELTYARLYVVHPSTKLWARLLVIKEPCVNIDISKGVHEPKFEVSASAVRLNIPHQFLFYTVIDNILTFAKAIKQLDHNFKNMSIGLDKFDRIMPEEKSALKFPHVNIKTRIFGLTIENDPFENELAYIYELGVIEQKERMKKLKLFEKRAEELRSVAVPDLEEQIEVSDAQPFQKPKLSVNTSVPKFASPLSRFFCESCHNHHSHTHVHGIHSTKFFKKRQPTSEDIGIEEEVTLISSTRSETEAKIQLARENLEKGFATSWIQKFRLFKEVKNRGWHQKCARAWGDDVICETIIDKFDILNYHSGPHLFGGVFRQLDFTLEAAKIADVDQFLYEFGKKQPKLEYSILVPLFFRIKSKSLYVFLRDYPLPLISFPENHDQTHNTVNLYGNLVINEKLVHREEEMRFVFVPFSPSTRPNQNSDNFYSVFIPRTLTPVKFVFDLNCDLDADRACMLSWCKSYSPAMGAASAAFDNFTKPKIDDSPIGWWDKVALLVHGRFRFNIANELCLHMKSSSNPYELQGKAAGFVFCWKNNVSLRINDTEDSKELIVLESDDFLLAIPNYSYQEKKSWSLFYDEVEEYIPDIDSESKKFSKRVMKLSSAEKVRWVLGMLYERNKIASNTFSDHQERVSTFKPHYDVVVTNPAFDWHPDSYDGYRSDYIHMAISVISKSSAGNCYNAAYLSPLTFHYFFTWWSMLKDGISLPVRQGPLFKTQSIDPSHVKMGSHLFTIKYQLVFNPLTISHTYMHASSDESHSNKIAFTGLKAKFAACSIDLHQRKEYVTYVNEKLNIHNKVQHLKMNQAEIQAEEADVRFLTAIFKDTSIMGQLESYLDKKSVSIESPTTNSSKFNEATSTFKGWIDNVDVFDNDFSWVDPDDFVELEVREPLSPYPKIKIMPFCFTPKFSYVREFSLQKDGGDYPFGNEESHDCLMGIEKPEETQGKLLRERSILLRKEMKENEELLKKLQNQNGSEFAKDAKRIELDLQVQKEKLDVVEAVYERFTNKSLSRSSSIGEQELQKVHSRALSVYSSHTVDEMRDAYMMNQSVSEFHNRFIVHNLQLKWDNGLRDSFMEYIQRVSDRKSLVYFMSKKAVDLVSSVINEQWDQEDYVDIQETMFNKEFKRGEDVINGFNDEIDEVNNDAHEAEHKYLIKLIHPQIQLISEKNIDSCVLITSTDLEMRIIGVNLKGSNLIIGESSEVASLVETRYGVLFNDSHMFVFTREDSMVTHPPTTYGAEPDSTSINWPPWLECEVCYDSSWARNQLIAERNSMACIFKKLNPLFSERQDVTQSNEMIVQLAKIVVNANSEQYSALYYVVTDLLVHSKPKQDNKSSRLDKIVELSDNSDFQGLDLRVKELQESIREYAKIVLKFDEKGSLWGTTQREQIKLLELELEKHKFELTVLMKGLRMRSTKSKSHKQHSKHWNILADQVIWHFLDDNREPFVDIALASSRFARIDSFDGSNKNKLEITMIQGFNLQQNAVYPELLRPFLEGKDMDARENQGHHTTCSKQEPIISMDWKMLEPVGGIPIMRHAKLAVQPLKVALDYDTAKKIFSYLFPNDDDILTGDNDDNDEDGDEEDIADTASATVNPLKNFINKHRTSSRFGSSSDLVNDSDSQRNSLFNMRDSESSSKRSSFDDLSLSSETKDKPRNSHKCRIRKQKNGQDEDEIAVIIGRSMKYISFVDIEVTKFKLFVSFKPPKHLNILDVHELLLNIPTLSYKNKVWSGEDFILRLRKDIIKIILNHTGKILGNKFKQRKRKTVAEPLKQISDYASFMTIKDLQ